MTTAENPQNSPPVRSRAAARQAIREQIETQAHTEGYTSHAAESEAEYQEWQTRAGIKNVWRKS